MSYAKDFAEFGVNYAQENGVDYAEARLINGQRTFLFLRNGMLVSGSQRPWLGIGFRVLKNGGLAFMSIDELSKNTVKDAINHGIKMVKGSNPKEKIDFGEPISNEAKWAVATKQRVIDVDTDTMLELLQEMDKKAENHGINTRANFFEAQSNEKYLVTSEGTRIESESSMLKFYGILTAKGLLDSEQRWVDLTRSTGWEGTKTWIDKYDNDCASLAKVAAQSNNRITGKIDFVVGPEVVGIICHENCGHPSEGDRIKGREGAQAGESFWRDLKLKESRVGSEHVTIAEDPTIPGTGGYYEYDDEGVKARERILIKDGMINEPLLNREYGVKFKLGSNGAARSSDFNREPIIRMANTYMKPGDFTLEELIEGVKHGIYMLSFTEWNIDDRRYQSKYVGFECYEIKNGEVTETMVRRPVMELTSKGLFSSIDAVSKDLVFDFPGICGKSDPAQGVPVYAGGGCIRMRDIKLG
ncbi:MAG: TldD/PmbA family protein [Candidatus Heimdallarchaeota archaeon]|nr:MAG: TldD/PmbA family protein [Candidatus Heimdallarchaeota archaeon]